MKIKKGLKIIVSSYLLVFSSSFAYAQSWLWSAAGFHSFESNQNGSYISADDAGNAYITGSYGPTVFFGANTLNCTNYNTYLVKYNSSGKALWAVQPADSAASSSYGLSVATDRTGNIYVCGKFQGSIAFNQDTLRAPASAVFIVKYDAGGNVLWAIQSTYSPGAEATSIATDKYNNVYVTGNFEYHVCFGADTLTAPFEDAFVIKCTSSGNIIWARQAALPSNNDLSSGSAITTDNNGNVCIGGYFKQAVTWGSYQLTDSGSNAAFLVKYSAAGNLLWAKQSLNVNYLTGEANLYSLITDEANNIYITGSFTDSVKFGAPVLYSPSFNSTFLVKYDTNGNVIWAKQSSIGLIGTSLTTDKASHIYLGGYTENDGQDTNFNFGAYVFYANPSGNNGFILNFDTDGTVICSSVVKNVGYEEFAGNNMGIVSDSGEIPGYIYVTGTFENDTVVCGPDTLAPNTYGTNIFIARWQSCTTINTGINPVNTLIGEVSVYPNPSNGVFTLMDNSQLTMDNEEKSIEVYNALGQLVYSKSSIVHFPLSIDLSGQPNGVYLYRVISENGDLAGEGKLVIQR